MAEPTYKELDEAPFDFKYPDMRLRDAFAQLLAMNQREAVPMEAVMAAQGRSQFPPPAAPAGVTRAPLFERKDTLITPLDIQRPQGYSIDNTVRAPTRFIDNTDPNLRFPVQGEADRANPAEALFGGKGLVVGPYPKPYELPKKSKKNKKKSKEVPGGRD
jgi:hypothetical protein